MLDFKPISAEQYNLISPILKKEGYNSCETSFPSLFVWSEYFNTKMCVDGETVFTRTELGGETVYLFPVGGDIKTAFEKLSEHTGGDFTLRCVTGRMRKEMEKAFPGGFSYVEERDTFDYIYDRDSLATLAGNKLHQKRNHVNRFMKRYDGRFRYETMTVDKIPQVIEYQKEWLRASEQREDYETLKSESAAISRLLENFIKLELLGGLVFIDDAVKAYCIGTKISDNTIDVMVEKGDYNFDGIYQYINREFVRNECESALYINREDDAGVEGLRKAKMSYNPAMLLKKYAAVKIR